MTAVAQSLPVTTLERPQVRRFELADLSQHGKWAMPRLLQAYPQIDQRNLAGWLNGSIWSAEKLFLYMPHALAMAEVVRVNTLEPKPVIWERFVFVEDPKDPDHLAEAADFYDEMKRWAKHHGADTIIVRQKSDVPEELVRAKLGRLFQIQQTFVKVTD